MTFRSIVDPTDPAVGAATRIYGDSIPAAERKPDAWIADAVRRDDFRVITASAGGDVVALATVFVPPDSKAWALFEYLAVDERCRGSGIGAAMFRHVVDAIAGRALLLEVDSDSDPSPLQHERSRRLAFYRRLGCRRVLGLHYILPLNANPPPPPMELLIANPPDALTLSTLRAWVTVVYERVYERQPDDARIATMFNGLTDPLRLE